MSKVEAQSMSVKRAEVEFHNFASFGEPERALRAYAEENLRRSAVLRNHQEFIGAMTPFCEIGANAGHTSYMLENEFGARGFAVDLSADSLRHGIALMSTWRLSRAPIRIAGDALHLPFRDGALRAVLAFQMLSQFMDIEQVFLEAKRVLAPGGVFILAEEPLKRLLSLRLYRCPYWERMKPWEKKLFEWGLLGYLVRDVIGADQEESFGIRQNHTTTLKDWHRLTHKHFEDCQYEVFVPGRGWGEQWMKRLAIRLDRYRSEWRAARLLGGTIAAVCRKAGLRKGEAEMPEAFEELLQCPDCTGDLRRDEQDTIHCSRCEYAAPNEGGVYNLLPSRVKKELYPGDRADVIDFTRPGHEARLIEGFYDLEGVYGNKYRWIGQRASAKLVRVSPGPQRLRIRGFASEKSLHLDKPLTIEASANGLRAGTWTLDRPGLFLLEADLPDAPEYRIDISASPVWKDPADDRILTVNLSLLRLVPREQAGP